MRVLVVGAGPAGLVTAKVLRSRGHDVSIVEAGGRIGGTFENKAYEGGRMVSSKYLTAFSDFRSPDAELHMTLADYVVYLEEYVDHFDLRSVIRLRTRVVGVRRKDVASAGRGGYVVNIERDDEHPGESSEEHWDAVAVCSGVHNVPRVPQFPGQERFEGRLIHSSEYKEPSLFKDKRVLIVGTGETAFDLGYAAATTGDARSVAMCTRHGFVSVPASFGKEMPPLDCMIMNFGTHAWESQWSQRVGFHWFITTKFTRLGFFFMTGCTYGFNQWVGKRYNLSWDQGSKHIVNKSSKCMPLLTRVAKRRAWFWQRLLYSFWDGSADHGLDIDLVEGSISDMEATTVRFDTKSGPRAVDADVVVLATGYRQRFPFLCPDGGEDDDRLPEEHFILNPEEPRLAYIGFVRPNVGAIPPMAELQAMWWAARLEGLLQKAPPAYYRLLESRLPYGVDYGRYMFALARELGAVPDLLRWLFKNPRVFITCAFGQAHVPIFRLQGPFRDASAEVTCASELLSPIVRRPLFMNAIFVIEALCFGAVNAVAFAVENFFDRVALARARLQAAPSGDVLDASDLQRGAVCRRLGRD